MSSEQEDEFLPDDEIMEELPEDSFLPDEEAGTPEGEEVTETAEDPENQETAETTEEAAEASEEAPEFSEEGGEAAETEEEVEENEKNKPIEYRPPRMDLYTMLLVLSLIFISLAAALHWMEVSPEYGNPPFKANSPIMTAPK